MSGEGQMRVGRRRRRRKKSEDAKYVERRGAQMDRQTGRGKWGRATDRVASPVHYSRFISGVGYRRAYRKVFCTPPVARSEHFKGRVGGISNTLDKAVAAAVDGASTDSSTK